MSPIYINNKKIESIYTNNQSIGKVYVGNVLVFQKNNYTGNPFIFTIDTTLGTGNSFDLPLRSGYNYDMLVDWGDGSSDIITSYNQAEKLHTYSTGGDYTISVTGLCEAWYFNYGGDKLKLTTINQWGNTGFVNMYLSFWGCSNLTTVNDTDGTWCSNVTNMTGMFYDCSSLTTLDVSNWNVSNVTNMQSIFNSCSSLTTLDVSNWNISNASNMKSMFENCSSLAILDVSNWSGYFLNEISDMFQNCSSLTTIDVSNWNVLFVNDMSFMFFGCSSLTTLDVSNWNVSNVVNMTGMFYNTPLDTTSYDALLNGWSQLPSLQSNVPFDANLSQYSCAAEEAHNTLTSPPNRWSITDLGLNVASCNGDPFMFTIDTTLGTGNSFDLPLRSGYNYDFVVDWGDGNTNTVTSFDDVNKTHTYANSGEYQISITGLCETWLFNGGGGDELKLTSIEQWGDTRFISMLYAFRGCSNLTTVNDTDGTWCSSVSSMSGMFLNCSSLETLDVSNWNVSNVTSMSYMFRGCESLETLDVSNWNVSNVKNMRYMFYNCSSLITLDASNWNTSNVTNMERMFYECSSLTTLNVNNWDVSNITYMSSMFPNCSSLITLDVSNWDVSNVTEMVNMFYGCSSLTTIDVSKWNVSNVTNMQSMFFRTPLDIPSYDALLIGWSQLPSLQSNIQFGAQSAKYSSGAAATARRILTSAPNNWSIIDAGQL